MSEQERIEHRVGKLRHVRRFQVLAEYVVVGLFWGALPAALLILVSKLTIIPWLSVEPWHLWVAAGGLVILGILSFIVTSLFVKITPLMVANDIDLSLGLRERVSSAMALSTGQSGKLPFVKTLVKDAAETVDGLAMKKVYPWGIPRAWKLALPVLIIAGGLLFLPQFNLFAGEDDREEIQLVQEQGKKLTELAKRQEELAEEREEPVIKQQAEEIKRVGEKLESGQVKKKEALKELTRLKERLESEAKQNIPEGQKQLIAELSEQLMNLKNTRELGELLDQGDMQAFANQLEQLLMDLRSGKLSPADQQLLEDLAKALEAALESEAADNPEAQLMKKDLEALKQAIAMDKANQQALKNSLDAFQKDLSNLTDQLSAAGMDQQSKQLEQMMNQMQQEMAQNGSISQQTMNQMQQSLKQAGQAVEQDQSMGEEQKNELKQAIKECESYFDGEQGEQGELSKQNRQVQQGRQAMAQQLGQTQKDCTGGT